MCKEDAFHMAVVCPSSYRLWQAMNEVWDIPEVDDIVYNGPEWLFDVLRKIDVEARGRVILLIWRIWQLRNDVTHDKVPAPLEAT